MQHLDRQVIEGALRWSRQGETVWLCTVLATFGSSPRPPGALMVATHEGRHIGSLSGGCVEEAFLARLGKGGFDRAVTVVSYGNDEGDDAHGPRVTLPCGGVLEVLVERLSATPATHAHLEHLAAALAGQQRLIRRVDLISGRVELAEAPPPGPSVTRREETVELRLGPSRRLIIAGISPITAPCAAFAVTLGFEVIVCDPRETACADFDVPGVRVEARLPSAYITPATCHAATAVVALTHDPRIDDLAMMEAVRTPAFYLGVMGSRQTSAARRERLLRAGGMTEESVARIHMPIGLALGSKTPAEIALAVMADIVRTEHGRAIDEL
ncbi:XdhC family protein [Halomonas dongshanensis]|uniref:XdhC family protein n=1 Tax=Halomonas dongshanensis TaxID=2890835 RepID=A0ABT2E8V8_9GAMM|nr:XdhC family protein [Halomonas dongshanensis]MCS2607944.1 XdhC family protein [Halomonas dongshanensis]